jgi:hypothetical protein
MRPVHDLHLVLSECEWQGWLDNLTTLKGMGFETIYPGHGAKFRSPKVLSDFWAAARPLRARETSLVSMGLRPIPATASRPP